jgi:alpha-tubulin suppressor-like RCC1 family protein
MYRILAAMIGVVLGSLVSVASPAQAASGPWASVAAGQSHTCAINTSKTLYCWGLGASGQLGDGTNEVRKVPTMIGASGVWASVAAGGQHTCAISTSKSLYCWGYRDHGQVGDGTTEPLQQFVPKRVGTAGVWVAVSTGFAHTCAITTGKSLYCWGWNDFGQLGIGVTGDRFSPKKVGTAGVWAKVSSGGGHTCALSTGKSLYCWGYNQYGQIGDGSTDDYRPTPRKIP